MNALDFMLRILIGLNCSKQLECSSPCIFELVTASGMRGQLECSSPCIFELITASGMRGQLECSSPWIFELVTASAMRGHHHAAPPWYCTHAREAQVTAPVPFEGTQG